MFRPHSDGTLQEIEVDTTRVGGQRMLGEEAERIETMRREC